MARFLQAFPGPDLHRIDDHAIALREAVVFEVIETTDAAVDTSVEELERRGVQHRLPSLDARRHLLPRYG